MDGFSAIQVKKCREKEVKSAILKHTLKIISKN